MHVGKPWRKNSVPQDAIQGKINIGKALDGISDNYLLSPGSSVSPCFEVYV